MGFSYDYSTHKVGDCLVVKNGDKIFTYPPKGGVLIFNHDLTKIVIVRNKYNNKNPKWGLPKGHKEGTEAIENTARRETFEEIGLNIPIQANHPYVKVNNSFYYVFSISESILKNLEPNESKEIAEIKLVDINTIHDNYYLNRELHLVLKKKIKFAKKKHLKLDKI